MLRSMFLSSASRLYSPPDDPAPAVVDPPEPVIVPDVEVAANPEPDPPDPAAPVVADPPLRLEPTADWKDKELKRKHRQVQEAKQRERDLQAQLDDANALLARAAGSGDPAPEPRATPPVAQDVVPRSEVQAEAKRIVAADDFNRQCNDLDKAGKEAYKEEWGTIAETLTTLGGFTQDEMNGILATDNPAKVLYELGKNPDKYHEIKDLPPAKRLAAVVKIGLPDNKPVPKPSSAPEPVDPVTGRGGRVTEELDDKMSDDDWHRKRDVERLKRMSARNGNSLRA